MATSPQAQHYVECECGKPVEYFCNPCGVQLCKPCITRHLGIKSLKGHEIAEYANRKLKSTTCFCESHTEIECLLFCNTCDIPVCYICVSTKHKQHDMVELHEKTAHVKSLIIEDIRTLQSEIRPVYKKALTRISSQLLTVPRHFLTVRDKLKSTRSAWHKEVDDVMREFETEVDHMEADQMTIIQKQNDIFEKRLLEIDKTIKENDDIKDSKNPNILLKFKSNIQQHRSVPAVLDFKFPSFISKTVDHKELKRKIGSLDKLEFFDYSQYEILVRKMKDCKNEIILHQPLSNPAIDDTGFPSTENNVRIYSVAHLSHERVWVGGFSQELKLMDLQGRLLDTVTITCRGLYIALTPDGHLVYSDYRDNAIKMVCDDNTIKTLTSTGEWRPKGITSTTSGDILVCLDKKNQGLFKVAKYSKTGDIVQEIQYDANNHPLYSDPLCIEVNKNNDIATVNLGSNSLVLVNEFGIFRLKYNGKQTYKKVHFNALDTDLAGNILICDAYNQTIHMLDMDGHVIGIIAPQGLDRPGAICIVEFGKVCVGEVSTGKVKLIKYLKN